MRNFFKQGIAYILLISLLLESCSNPYMGGMAKKAPMFEPSSTKNLAIGQTNDLLEPLSSDTSLNPDNLALIQPMDLLVSEQGSLQAQNADLFKSKDLRQQNETDRNIPTLIQPIDRVVSNREPLQASLPNTRQEKTVAKQQKHQALSDKKPSFSRRNRIPDQNQLRASQQEAKQNRRTNPSSQVLEEVTKAVDQLAPASQGISSVVASKPEANKNPQTFIAKGGHQVRFQQQASGQWVAVVEENLPVGISRRLCLPVYLEPGQSIATLGEHSAAWQKNNIHVVLHNQKSYVFVGVLGLLGGMMEDGAAPRKIDKKEDEPIPTDLSGKLKYLYKNDNTLPKLIEDEDIKEQSIKDYYVKLQVVLQEDIEQEKSAAAKDKVVGQKQSLEIDKIFDKIDKDHLAAGKVLLLGGAGIGKTTLMHYISHQWANGNLWGDKYEHVFRVRLKELLDSDWILPYKGEKEADLLACFIDSCLKIQKSVLRVKLKNNNNKELARKLGELEYDLPEIKQLFRDKKEKVLLLVDGYDEIVNLKGKKGYDNVLEFGVFEHPHVIMTSRPNAASRGIRKEFERQIESQGLDDIGINQYVDLHFKQKQRLGQELKAFLSTNSQVRGMCEVPINMALLSVIWKDSVIRAKLSQGIKGQTSGDFKLVKLYQELIVWLGKRYLDKKEENVTNLTEEALYKNEVMKVLIEVAYEYFTGEQVKGLKEGALGVKGEAIANMANNHKTKIEEVYKYGLLRGEGDPKNLKDQTHYFIHLTFQEYLTAYHLKELLSQKAQVQAVATWIAHHRNEPKYLMTLKFLAGLVSQAQGPGSELLVQRFWEAASCNVDGVLELGLEGKITLLMHLLAQSMIKGQFDSRIPNLEKMQQLIDGEVVANIDKWGQQIIESGYLSSRIVGEINSIMQGAVELGNKEQLGQGKELKLKVAVEVVSKMVDKGVFGTRDKIFEQFIGFIKLKGWQLQKLGIEKATEIIDKTIDNEKLEKNTDLIVKLLLDMNLEEVATDLIVKIGQIELQVVFKNLKSLKELNKKKLGNIDTILPKIVKGLPQEKLAKAFNLVKERLDSQDDEVWSGAYSALIAIVKRLPQEKLEEAFTLVKPLLADKNFLIRSRASDALREISDALRKIVKVLPQGKVKEAFNLVKPLLSDSYSDVRRSASSALIGIVQELPQEKLEEAFTLVKPLLADEVSEVRSSASSAFIEIVKRLPQEKAFTLIKPLLADENWLIRTSRASPSLRKIVTGSQEKVEQAFSLVKTLRDDQDSNVRSRASSALSKIVKVLPQEKVEGALNFFRPLLAEKDLKVRRFASSALIEIVKGLLQEKAEKAFTEEAFTLVKSLLADEVSEVRRNASSALIEIVQELPQEKLEEAFNLVKPLLADEVSEVRSIASSAFIAIVKRLPQDKIKKAFKLVKTLLNNDQDSDVQNSAFKALSEIVKGLPQKKLDAASTLVKRLLTHKDRELGVIASYALIEIVKRRPQDEAFNLVKLLLTDQDSNVRSRALSALSEIVKVLPQEKVRGKEASTLVTPVRGDQDSNVRSRAPSAVREKVNGLLKEEVFTLVKPLLADKDPYVRRSASSVLIEIVKRLPPDKLDEAFNFFKPLLDDKDSAVQINVCDALREIVKVMPQEEVKKASILVQPLLSHQNSDVLSSAYSAFIEIVKKLPQENVEEAFNFFRLLLDYKDSKVRSIASSDALKAIIERLPFVELVKLLADCNSTIRAQAQEALAEKFKLPEEVAKLSHIDVISLLKLIAATKGTDEVEKDLYTGVSKVLKQIAAKIDQEGLKWLNAHFAELHDTPAWRTFLKTVLHKALSDGIIDEGEAQLFIQCILRRGIAATIDLKGNKIILEDSSYPLKVSSQANLMHIVNEVIKLSKDELGKQYREHAPLFVNRGSALPIAAADIEWAGSVVDSTKLESEKWHLSVMHLSDHHKKEPQEVFLLLEQRNYVGEHIIHKITLDKGKFTIDSHALNPLEVGSKREALFGKMSYIDNKPRYYGSSFTLEQATVKKLLERCKVKNDTKDAYQALHGLAKKRVDESKRFILEKSWSEYVTHSSVKTYKKDELLKVDAEQVRKDSRAIESQDETQKLRRETKEQLDKLNSILEISGIKEHAEIMKQLEEYKTNNSALFSYCTTFIWTLKSYMDAYAVASSGLIATNQESSTAEDIGMYVMNQAVAFAGNLIPVVGGFVGNILAGGVNKIYSKGKEAKQDNKISVINELFRRGHTSSSGVERSIAQAALEIVKRKEAVISKLVVKKKHVVIEKVSELREKIGELTDRLLRNYKLEQSPQAEMAVEDVVWLMARLYEQYEMLKANPSNAKFHEQVAELVCEDSLQDMIRKSATVRKKDLDLVASIFNEKTLQAFKEKASKGSWKKFSMSRGKECEEYFFEHYIKKKLDSKTLSASNENILAVRIVLFKTMSAAISDSKNLKCAKEFGKAYQNLTKQIARVHPTYFRNKAIAECCITDDDKLLAEVKAKLTTKTP